jgi:hypothetical protein
MLHAAFRNPVRAGGKPGGFAFAGERHIGYAKKRGGPYYGAQVMIIPHGNENEPCFPFPGPPIQILPGKGLNYRLIDHGSRPLVVVALADPFQLLVIAELRGFFPICQGFAQPRKLFQPVRPEKKPLDPFRMMLS